MLSFSEAVTAASKDRACVTRAYWRTEEWRRLYDRGPHGIVYVMLFDAMALGVSIPAVARSIEMWSNAEDARGPLVRVMIDGSQKLYLTYVNYSPDLADMMVKDWRVVPREEIAEFLTKRLKDIEQAAAEP